MINIATINPEQEAMLASFDSLLTACKEKEKADAKLARIMSDKTALDAYWPEWNEAFQKQVALRTEACGRVCENPYWAADLIERLLARVQENSGIR